MERQGFQSHISPIKIDEIFSCELIIPRFNFNKIEAPAIHKEKYRLRGIRMGRVCACASQLPKGGWELYSKNLPKGSTSLTWN
jgi:hypothetical protein